MSRGHVKYPILREAISADIYKYFRVDRMNIDTID